MCTNDSRQRLSPYVLHPYSYAFGRSNRQLQYITIGDLLSKRAESEDKTKTAIISYHENIRKTYEQLNSDVNQLANGLYTNLGLRRGDVVGVWSCNCYAWVQILHACAKLGLILCTINPVYKAQEINYILRKSQISTLFMPGVNSLQETVNEFHKIFKESLKMTDELGMDALKLKHVVVLDGLKPNIIKYGIEFHLFESLLSNENINRPNEQIPCPDDPALLIFTSGTTGKPKGALLSQFTVINNTILYSCYSVKSEENHMILCLPLPLFHIGGAVFGGIYMIANPIGIVLTGYKYNVKSIVDSIKLYNCTHINLTPTVLIDILSHVEKLDISLCTIKDVIIAGASVPSELGDRITKRFPSIEHFIISYGTTETGTPLDFVEVKLVDIKTGIITEIGEQGELLCRGHNVMIGYWRDEQKTNESIIDGYWYKTGDLAVMDDLGYIKIIGRIKDMVIRGGVNIYPREIENLLRIHSDVIDAYVIGVPDQRLGEELCAWIKLTDNSKIIADDLKEFFKNKFSYFKIPRYILFVNEFPLTPIGKPKKFVMREKSCELLGLNE